MGVALVWMLFNFDFKLSVAYIVILFLDYFWFTNDRKVSFPWINKNISQTAVFIESIAGFGVFLGLTMFFISGFNTQSLINVLSSTTPIFADSVVFTIIGWGFVIPIIETRFFFGSFFEGITTYLERRLGRTINPQVLSASLFFVMTFVGATFTLFHLSAKGLSGQALMVTFIFAIISMLLVVRQKSLKGATIMHILSNTLATMASLGLIGGIL